MQALVETDLQAGSSSPRRSHVRAARRGSPSPRCRRVPGGSRPAPRRRPSSPMRTSRSSIRRDSRAAFFSLRVVQSHRVSTFSSASSVPASRTYRRTATSDQPIAYVWNRRCNATSSDTFDDVVVRVAHRRHPLARHPCADRIVVVERRSLALQVPPGAGLADVVEQRGEAGDPEVERPHRFARRGARCRSDAARSPRRRSCASARPCDGGSDRARAASPAVPEGTDRRGRSRRGTTDPADG